MEMVCSEEGIDSIIEKERIIKDEGEISIMRKAADITNSIIDSIETSFSENLFKTELDAAVFIETEARKYGAEGVGFETIAAGSERSYAIHAFPSFTNKPIGTQGLSILDFGIKYRGYTSDVTMTIARNPSKKQKELLFHVEKAYNLALETAAPGVLSSSLAENVDDYFSKNNYFMPHSLGHGIGLDAHEDPLIRNTRTNKTELKPGMIITIEPGLYYPETGGARLENDILITENGMEVLTRSRILNFP